MLKTKDELAVVSTTVTETTAKGSAVSAASQLCADVEKFSSNDQCPSDLQTN